MRRPRKAGGIAVAVLVALASVGCFGRGSATRSADWFDQVRGRTAAPPGLSITTVLLDQPAGDPYLNGGLWTAARSPLPHELSTLLAQNGLRVGVVSGMPPGEFTTLLGSDRSALDRMFRTMRPDVPKVVAVNGPIPRCSFRTIADLVAEPKRHELGAAECGLVVAAEAEGDGRVKLRCEWQVQHGDRQGFLNPTEDGSGFTRRDHKPREAFPTLAFDVVLGPTDHLVVGAAADPADTLGEVFFIAAAPGRVRQRVLVVQASRGAGVAEASKGEKE